MLRRTNAALTAIATAGSLLAYSAIWAPATAQATGSGYVQLAAAYNQVVQTLQSILNQSGYDAGPVDGLMGSRTRLAIEAYQRANGLLVTGQPSQGLLEHMQTSAMAQQPTQQPTPQPVTQPTMPSKQMVIDIQSELRRRGYDVSVVDGDMDDETAAAIRAYQRDSRLAITGKATDGLLANLRYQTKQPQEEYGANIRDVQQALNARGYNAGPADGVMGPATRNAIRTYQVDAGDEATGRINSQLLTRLNIVAAASGTDEQEEVDPGEKRRYGVVLSDNFADGNYTADPVWKVYRGRFRVDGQRALRSRVDAAEPEQAANPQRTGDTSKDTLFAVLEQAFQREERSGAAESGTAPATIGTAVPIDRAYRMRVQVSVHNGDGRFVFGPYQTNVDSGYLLAYSLDNGSSALRLLSVTGGETQLVAETNDAPSLDDGRVHQLEWLRYGNGMMEVAVDGTRLLKAMSNVYRNDFDGFTFTNFGGDFGIHEVMIEDRNRELSG